MNIINQTKEMAINGKAYESMKKLRENYYKRLYFVVSLLMSYIVSKLKEIIVFQVLIIIATLSSIPVLKLYVAFYTLN